MCLSFIYVSDDPKENEFQVIIASNRDEYFARPAMAAKFWNSHCLSGLDNQPSKEGGTWLGVSTFGKIGILLNILEPHSVCTKKGRGFLVTNFLVGEKDAFHYSQDVAEEKDEYNKFNLVLLQKKISSWEVVYYNNVDQDKPCRMSSGVLAFGNSSYRKPWKKIKTGEKIFNNIIACYNSLPAKESLKEELLKLLSDRTKCWPDDQLESQLAGSDNKFIKCGESFSSNFVCMPDDIEYGTRTHTIILIDGNGKGQLTEITMKEPMSNWNTSTINFNVV